VGTTGFSELASRWYLLQPDQVSVRALHAVAGDDVRVLAKNEAGRSECNAIGPGYVTGAKTASY